MKKLLAFALVIAALVLGACSKGDKNLLRAVPDDTEVLARIDLAATAKSMGYTWSDALQKACSKLGLQEGNGLDMTGTAYAFVTEDARLSGIVLPVDDADELREFLTSNGETVINETDGVYSDGRSLAFDDSRLVVAVGSGASAFNLHSLLKQTVVEDDVDELNSQLDNVDDPVAVVIDGEILKKQAAKNFYTGMALATLPVGLDDIYLLIGIDATETSAIISTSVVAEDSEAEDKLDDMKKRLAPIKDGKIPFVADNYLALVAMNLRGSDFAPYAAMLEQFGAASLVNALDGLATFTLTGYDLQKDKPSFTFTAQANDIKCLDGLMEFGKAFLPIKDEGHHNWTISDGNGDNILVGAQGGFVFANYGNGMQRPKGNNTIALEEGTVVYMRALPGRVPLLAGYGVKEVEFYSTDEMTTHTTITLGKTWREIFEQE